MKKKPKPIFPAPPKKAETHELLIIRCATAGIIGFGLGMIVSAGALQLGFLVP